MMQRLLLALILLFTASSIAYAGPKEMPAPSAAQNYVDGVVREAFDIIEKTRSEQITEADAKSQFRVILNKAFDIPTIARFTMGRYWRVATPEQQKEFTQLLQDVILNKYADRVLDSSGNKYTMGNERIINERDTAVMMTIVPSNEPPVDLAWRVRKIDGSFKVIDLSVEGISMSVTHRTDFASVIERNGGNVSALIDALKRKKI